VTESTVAATYVEAGNQVLSASNGVDYAYRTTGEGDAPPLVTLQHFRGNLDNWDPALIDALARGRRVVSFDNRGGRSVKRDDTQHDRADGARRDRLHRCARGR
jgi:pimeloyl-ACP methyl ester carboxylesterase